MSIIVRGTYCQELLSISSQDLTLTTVQVSVTFVNFVKAKLQIRRATGLMQRLFFYFSVKTYVVTLH